jgi:hypothetical protein
MFFNVTFVLEFGLVQDSEDVLFQTFKAFKTAMKFFGPIPLKCRTFLSYFMLIIGKN